MDIIWIGVLRVVQLARFYPLVGAISAPWLLFVQSPNSHHRDQRRHGTAGPDCQSRQRRMAAGTQHWLEAFPEAEELLIDAARHATVATIRICSDYLRIASCAAG